MGNARTSEGQKCSHVAAEKKCIEVAAKSGLEAEQQK